MRLAAWSIHIESGVSDQERQSGEKECMVHVVLSCVEETNQRWNIQR